MERVDALQTECLITQGKLDEMRQAAKTVDSRSLRKVFAMADEDKPQYVEQLVWLLDKIEEICKR